MRILWGICGSFCNHKVALQQIQKLIDKGHSIQVVVTDNVYRTDTRFYKANDYLVELERVTGKKVMHTIVEVEPIGPFNGYDIMVIAPMTATVMSKLVHGNYDNSVAMAAKAIIRNKHQVVVAFATNDALGISGVNLMNLINMKNFYIVPFYQDDPIQKPLSLMSDFTLIEPTIEYALKHIQYQPLLLVKGD